MINIEQRSYKGGNRDRIQIRLVVNIYQGIGLTLLSETNDRMLDSNKVDLSPRTQPRQMSPVLLVTRGRNKYKREGPMTMYWSTSIHVGQHSDCLVVYLFNHCSRGLTHQLFRNLFAILSKYQVSIYRLSSIPRSIYHLSMSTKATIYPVQQVWQIYPVRNKNRVILQVQWYQHNSVSCPHKHHLPRYMS